MRGRYLWNQREPAAMREALSEFRAAVEVDPTYAEAWAGIADTYVVPAGAALVENARARAIDAARRALALDSALAEAHASLAFGFVGQWAWEEAERHFRRAIDLNPSYATAHQWYAEFLVAQNRMEEAVASARRATVRDPLSYIIAWNLARVLYFARRPREALEQLRRIPGGGGDIVGVFSYVQLGKPDSAWAEILKMTRTPPPVRDHLRTLRAESLHPAVAMHRSLQQWPAGSAGSGEDVGPPEIVRRLIAIEAAVAEKREDDALAMLERLVASGDLGTFVVDLAADPLLDRFGTIPGTGSSCGRWGWRGTGPRSRRDEDRADPVRDHAAGRPDVRRPTARPTTHHPLVYSRRWSAQRPRAVPGQRPRRVPLDLHQERTRLRRVSGRYRWSAEAGDYERIWSNRDPQPWAFYAAGFGLWTTAMDYAEFMAMWLNRGRYEGVRVLAEETVEEALEPHGVSNGVRYGYGWFVEEARGAGAMPHAFSHEGGDGTAAIAFPADDALVIYLTHSQGTGIWMPFGTGWACSASSITLVRTWCGRMNIMWRTSSFLRKSRLVTRHLPGECRRDGGRLGFRHSRLGR